MLRTFRLWKAKVRAQNKQKHETQRLVEEQRKQQRTLQQQKKENSTAELAHRTLTKKRRNAASVEAGASMHSTSSSDAKRQKKTNASQAVTHRAWNSELRKFVCGCDRSFSTIKAWSGHQRSCQQQPPPTTTIGFFECTKCGTLTQGSNEAKQHEDHCQRHKSRKKGGECDFCRRLPVSIPFTLSANETYQKHCESQQAQQQNEHMHPSADDLLCQNCDKYYDTNKNHVCRCQEVDVTGSWVCVECRLYPRRKHSFANVTELQKHSTRYHKRNNKRDI